MSGVPDYLKGDRSYWLSEAGQMTRDLCEADLRDLAFYLDTLDTFVQEREKAETHAIIELHNGHDVNWADEHPYWWQDIGGEQVRRSLHHCADVDHRALRLVHLPRCRTRIPADRHGSRPGRWMASALPQVLREARCVLITTSSYLGLPGRYLFRAKCLCS